MKNNYSLYYSYPTLGDVLIVIFDNERKPTSHERKGNVEVIYNKEDIIGYNIFDIQNIIKIKSQGLIYLPSPTLVEVINSILINAKLEPLAIKEESGYVIAQIDEIKDLEDDQKLIYLNIGKEVVQATIKNKELKPKQKVVVAKANTRLNNGALVKEAHICTEKELSISELEEVLIIEDDEEVGNDFFMMEEKK